MYIAELVQYKYIWPRLAVVREEAREEKTEIRRAQLDPEKDEEPITNNTYPVDVQRLKNLDVLPQNGRPRGTD